MGASSDIFLIIEGTALDEAVIEARPREEESSEKNSKLNGGKLQLDINGERLHVTLEGNAIVFNW
jgi:hypothetical protein